MSQIEIRTVIDGVPYYVKAEPYEFNTEKRFRVFYAGREFNFAFDTEIGRYAAIDDDNSEIPDNLAREIVQKF